MSQDVTREDLQRYGLTAEGAPEVPVGEKAMRLVLTAVNNELKKKAEKTHKHNATDITEDETHRFATDAEKTKWNGKAEKDDITKAIAAIPDASKTQKGLMTTAQVTGMETMGQDIAQAKKDIEGMKAGNGIPLASQTQNGLMSKEDKKIVDGVEAKIAAKADKSHKHAATDINQDATHRFVTDVEKTGWADKYTKTEIDNKFSQMTTGMDWKESVATKADLATKYPNPQDGWTVNVNDTDITYRYTGTDWIAISANSIPKATQALDGLMSKEDKKALDGVDGKLAGKADKTHKHAATEITEDETHKFVTTAEKTKYEKASTDATYARGKADSNKGEIDKVAGRVTALETKTVLMTEEQAKAIINEIITGAFPVA